MAKNGWSAGSRRYGLLQMSDLEREMEQELYWVLDPIAALPIPSRRTLQNRRTARTLLGGTNAALSLKLLTDVAVTTAAVTIARTATTDNLNPSN